MASSWGARRGLPGYDSFRTGLTYQDVYQFLYSYDPDPSTWRYKGRRQVLWLWHKMKLEMFEETQRRTETLTSLDDSEANLGYVDLQPSI